MIYYLKEFVAFLFICDTKYTLLQNRSIPLSLSKDFGFFGNQVLSKIYSFKLIKSIVAEMIKV